MKGGDHPVIFMTSLVGSRPRERLSYFIIHPS